ncbi:MAG: NUDIX hydrolase [Rhizobiaceae bacterium]
MLLSHSTKLRMFDRIRMLFGGAPCLVQAAALTWRQGSEGVEVLLITSRDSGRWVLPKGWPEREEELWQAAEREACEEAGVSGPISHTASGSYFYGKGVSHDMELPCEAHVFALEVKTLAKNWPEKRQRTRKWFSASEAAEQVNEPDLGELILAFADNPRLKAA